MHLRGLPVPMKLQMNQANLSFLLIAVVLPWLIISSVAEAQVQDLEEYPGLVREMDQDELSFLLHRVRRIEFRIDNVSDVRIYKSQTDSIAKSLVEDGLILSSDCQTSPVDGVLTVKISRLHIGERTLVRLYWLRYPCPEAGILVRGNYFDERICSRDEAMNNVGVLVGLFGSIWKSSNIRIEGASSVPNAVSIPPRDFACRSVESQSSI